jgi:enoyl-CoA hydratase/carnithine racemase
MFLTGRRVIAEGAARTGLLTVRSERAPVAAEALCAELAANAPPALAGIKHGFALFHALAVSSVELAVFPAAAAGGLRQRRREGGRQRGARKRTPSFIVR